jgi:GT2 family glycosyltransferase
MNTPGPLLSVVIGSCNQLNTLKFTLLALLDQKPDIPHEIIVVDCGSTDGSDQFLARRAQDGGIRAILNPDSQGRTAARNQGAHAAVGRYLMFLDPGMIVGPRWWEALVRTLEMDARVAAAGGKVILPDGRIDHAGLALLEWWEQPARGHEISGYGSKITARSILAGKAAENPASNQPMQVQALAGEGIMVRASAFFAVGGFSARVGRHHHQNKADFEGELAGVDLCLRLGSRGWDCVYRYESVMTRLRSHLAQDGPQAPPVADQREQEVMNSTWLGRARGDFRIIPGEGTVPAEQSRIRRYIEPVISFEHQGTPSVAGRGLASVVVVTGNNLDETRRCVKALLACTDDLHEIIFVDRASTDGTAEFLARATAGRASSRIIKADAGAGSAQAHNLGLAAARGQHIILLSSQAVVTPGWLEILAATADLHTRAGLIGPVTNRAEGLQQISGVDYDEEGLRGLNSFAAQVAEGQAGRCDPASRLAGFCLLIKRELMARIGGLDERFRLGSYEDNDYCLRARLAGYECRIAGGCFVHRGGQPEFSDEQIARLKQISAQWEIFKTKWGIPSSQALGDPLDMGALLTGGFQPGRHFQPLPAAPEKTVAAAVSTQAAHA